MSDYEELRERRKATENLVSPDGEYTICIEREDRDGKKYFDPHSSYAHEGNILYLDNPKVGKYVRMPRLELYKVVGLGTERKALDTSKQVKAVYFREVNV